MLPVFIPSAQFCRACKWGSLSISTSFYTNARYVMWTALTLTMFSHWTSSLWWFLVSWLTLAIWCLCFGLLSTSERPVHWIYVWKGGGGWGGGREVVNGVLFTYTTYDITKKVFFRLLEFLYQTYNINVLILSFGPNIWGGAVTTSFL